MIKQFKEKEGVISNPYIGFTSFQHFRGEALYSDCISNRVEVCGCETESYECYPVPDGVEEKGREQGYHPDETVAYIRSLWKEFEPKQGEYNYAFIQNILDQAKAKGQTVMFRLMPHSTCARDDVPDWLKEIMPCPARPDGMRVKDSPTDPRYLKLFGKAVEKLGERFDQDATLDCIDVSLGGAWGEGSQDFAEQDIKALMDIYIRVFPNTKLLGQIGNTMLLNYMGKKCALGLRADGVGSPKHMDLMYPVFYTEMENEHWKMGPVSFESYWWISEWHRQGWDIDQIIEKTLEWHVSTFNTKSFPIQPQFQEKIERWLMKMGYRFVIKELAYPETIAAGKKLECRLKLENKGVAPIYNRLPLSIRLKSEKYTLECATDVDVRKWLPGEHIEPLSVVLPDDLPSGEYSLQVRIGGKELPWVQFATETPLDEEYSVLAVVNVKEA